MKLFSKFALAVAGSTLATSIASAGYLATLSIRNTAEVELAKQAQLLDRNATAFDGLIRELEGDVELLAGTPPIQGLARAEANGGTDPVDGSSAQEWKRRLAMIFSQLLRTKEQYLQARFVGVANEGLELVRVERTADGVRETAKERLQKKGHRPYVKAALDILNTPNRVYLSDIELNREWGIIQADTPVIRAAVPVLEEGRGRPYGLVIINMAATRLLQQLREGEGLHTTYVVNHEGQFLVHPEGERAFEWEHGRRATLSEELPMLHSALQQHGEETQIGPEGVTSARSIALERDNPQARRLGVLLHLPQSVGLEAFKQSIPELLALISGLTFLGLLVGLWLTNVASSPLRKLIHAAQRMSTNDAHIEIPEDLTGDARILGDSLRQAISLALQNQRLRIANRELEEFAHVASHDLQEPLRTLSSFADLLSARYSTQLDAKGQQCVRYVGEAAERMTGLIDGLLDLSRIGRHAHAEMVDLNIVAQEVIAELSALIDVRRADMELTHLPSFWGFRKELGLLLHSLISNALKFVPEHTSPHIVVDSAADRDGWRVWVDDNGPGISTPDRERVFRMFYRAQARGATADVGIGLAHAKKIVLLHGGRIWVEDSPLGGARLVFTIQEGTQNAAQRNSAS